MITSVDQNILRPNWKWLINPRHCLSLGFGCGLVPIAPGTIGTLAGVFFYLLIINFNIFFYLSVTLMVIGVATWAAEYTSEALGGQDHRAIVIDEIAGFLVACISLPQSWFYLILAFVLFRIFDITKPWPISFVDQYIKGGVGIVGDDLIAGIYTLLCIQSLVFVLLLYGISMH